MTCAIMPSISASFAVSFGLLGEYAIFSSSAYAPIQLRFAMLKYPMAPGVLRSTQFLRNAG